MSLLSFAHVHQRFDIGREIERIFIGRQVVEDIGFGVGHGTPPEIGTTLLYIKKQDKLPIYPTPVRLTTPFFNSYSLLTFVGTLSVPRYQHP